MNIQRVKAFVLTTQLGSVSAAARALGKRQPQVSQWIADLEVDIGVDLFERSANQVALTAGGEHLLPKAILALAQWEQFTQSATNYAELGKGRLVLGVENYIPLEVLRSTIQRYLMQFPTLDFVLKVDTFDALHSAFLSNDIDLLLLHETVELHQSQSGYCRLGEYQEVMLISGQHALASQQVIDPAQLAPYREYIWAGGQTESDDLEVGFSGHYCQIPDLALLKSLLAEGDGYSFLPLSLAQTEIDSGRLKVVQLSSEFAPMKRRLEMRWHHGFEASTLGSSLLTLIKEQLSK